MKTFNYSAFSFMPTNRGINNGLVKRLVKSIKEIGYIEARPVIVNQQIFYPKRYVFPILIASFATSEHIISN